MPALGHEDEDQDQSPQNLDPNDDTDESAQAKPEVDPNVPVVVEEDERLVASDEGDGDEDDVAPDAERNTRKRETAKERRERARQAKERDKQEIEILRRTVAKQNEVVEKLRQDTIANRVTDLDARIATAVAEHDQMDSVYYAAINKNPLDAKRAAEIRDAAKQRAWQLHNEKEQLIQQAKQAPMPAPVPYVDKARQFLADKQWYNPKAGDEDSLVVEALDRALSKTMDPNDPNYWSTLDAKVKARLPHRFAQSNQDDAQDDGNDDDTRHQEPTPRRKGPPTGGTSRSSGGSGNSSKEIRLPREMVEAMKEAGHWDDPKKRARVAQRYIDGVKARQSNG